MKNKKITLSITYINGTARIFDISSTPCSGQFHIYEDFVVSNFYLPINEAIDIVSRLGIYERWL